MKYKAILFDTRSIQKYIFSSNQLKTNIGASYLVDSVFEKVLLPAVRKIMGDAALDAASWRRAAEVKWSVMETEARVGYIGGGKALLLFDEGVADETLTAIVSAFTKKLLVHAPGLRTGAAIGVLVLAEDGSYVSAADGSYDGTKRLDLLFDRLKETQNTVFPVVNIPYTGLTLACSESGEAANAWVDGRFYAWEVAAKLHPFFPSGRKEADVQAELMDKLISVLPPEEHENFMKGYVFPMEFDRLGQKTPKNDIAVVHIDGNNMGRKFQGCKTLTEYIERSLAIRRDTIAAFAALVRHITEQIEHYKGALDLHEEAGLTFLPVRPIVLGGDDMTFVCAAKAAVEFSRFLMQHLMDSGIASCGGITIMNTKYPFFRAYEMAEELCGAAKVEMRALERAAGQEMDSCWLDFAILHGEQPPTLAQFRAQEYRGAYTDQESQQASQSQNPSHSTAYSNLHFGPYRIYSENDGAADEKNLAALLDAVDKLRYVEQEPGEGKGLPRNKIKELRRVLAYGRHEQQQFMTQLRHLNLRLPDVPAWRAYENALLVNGRTPYVDAIELMDYIIADEEA